MVQEIPQFRVTEAGLHTKLTNTEQKQNTGTTVKLMSTHTHSTKRIFSALHFFFLTTFNGHTQFDQYVMQHFKGNEEDENI